MWSCGCLVLTHSNLMATSSPTEISVPRQDSRGVSCMKMHYTFSLNLYLINKTQQHLINNMNNGHCIRGQHNQGSITVMSKSNLILSWLYNLMMKITKVVFIIILLSFIYAAFPRRTWAIGQQELQQHNTLYSKKQIQMIFSTDKWIQTCELGLHDFA